MPGVRGIALGTHHPFFSGKVIAGMGKEFPHDKLDGAQHGTAAQSPVQTISQFKDSLMLFEKENSAM
jgi:hypothetical protein